MSGEGNGGERRGDAVPPPSPSPLVQLELAILASDLAAAGPEREERGEPASRRTVLVVTRDPHLSRYIAQSLGMRADLVAVIADSTATASTLAREQPPRLVIADAQHVDVLVPLAQVPALLVLDETRELADDIVARRRAALAVIVRPFNARSLLNEVDRLLGAAPDAQPDVP